MKKLALIVFMILPFIGTSQTNEKEIFTIEQSISGFFIRYQNDVASAIQSIRIAEDIAKKKDEESIQMLITSLKLLKEYSETYYGYEVSSKQFLGSNYAKVTCLVKHTKPFVIAFEMYKPTNYWIIKTVEIDNEYDKLFVKASRN